MNNRPARGLSDSAAAELRAHLGRHGLSISEAAARIGVHQSWLGRRLNGTISPTLEDVELICRRLGLRVSDVIRDQPEQVPA